MFKGQAFFLVFFFTSNIVYADTASPNHRESLSEVNGFFDFRLGARTQIDPNEKSMSLGELRVQLETEKEVEQYTINIAVDFVYDYIAKQYVVDLERGEGIVDLRHANIEFTPLDYLDIKIGRQILTWGTGDLLFINDLFAKDWVSFLIGRDTEYLKAPTNAVKASFFSETINMDIVYSPKFVADRFISGKRVSFFDREQSIRRGENNAIEVERPDNIFNDDELALRFYKTFDVNEVALYYYDGFWKSPAGKNAISGNMVFPKLKVMGASIRGPVLSGIANLEVGYYKSESEAKNNPLVRNSEIRFLAAYEQELATELTGGFQYYLEKKLNYENYFNSLPVSSLKDDKYRYVISFRLTKLLLQQNLKLSFFNFYSTSDRDGYLRFNAQYKISDGFRIEGGINEFYGRKQHTFYSQFKNNSNVYSALRYEF